MSARSLGAVVWPSPWPALLQTLILALVALTAIRLQAPGIGIVAVTVSAAVLLALAQSLAPAYTPLYLPRLVVAGLLLAGLSVLALPIMERKYAGAYAIWAVTVLACALRLAGALFPPFAAYDLGLNLGRLFATVNGTLVATNESFEFGGGLTVYPSGPYLVLMPGMLAGLTPKLAVQGGIALIDGLATLGVVALGHALGLRRQAVVFGALAYAAVPIGLTTLWYGHTAQAFGQALMAPLAAALLWGMRGCSNDRVHSTHSPTAPTTLWPWLIGGTLMAMALLSHIGVTILALAWLGLLWLGVTLGRTLDRATWLRLTATLGFGGLAGLVFVYGPAALAHVEALRGLEFGGEGVAPKPSYNLIARAFWISYTPLGLLLAVAALPLARRRALPGGGGALLGAWVGAAALFCAVELVTGLQVRYLVFLTPLVCLAAGASLAWLAHRTPLGIWLAWVLALILVGQGAVVWLGGIFGPTAPSMVPLLR